MEWNYSPNSHQKIWRTNGLRTGVLLWGITVIHSKVGIITIGTWYRALWSPNLIRNHNKKGIQASFEIHLFWGNAPLCRVISLLKLTKKAKNYLFWPKIDQNVQFVPKNGGSPLFPRVFQFFWPRSLYHIPNVIIPTLYLGVIHKLNWQQGEEGGS